MKWLAPIISVSLLALVAAFILTDTWSRLMLLGFAAFNIYVAKVEFSSRSCGGKLGPPL